MKKNVKGSNNLKSETLGIFTALPEEYAAVREVLKCKEVDVRGNGGGRKYSVGKLRTKMLMSGGLSLAGLEARLAGSVAESATVQTRKPQP